MLGDVISQFCDTDKSALSHRCIPPLGLFHIAIPLCNRAKAGSYLSITVPKVAIAPQGFAYRELVFTVNGDVNGDDVIDDADLLAFLFAFSDSAADLNNDGVVDDADLLIVLFNFGATGG